MNCEKFTLLLDTPETERTQQQRQEMEEHVKVCPACAMAFSLQREMRAMDREESMPASFSASWREKIRREEKVKMNQQHFAWKKALAAAAAIVFVTGGTWLSYANGWGLESGRKAAPQNMSDSVPEYEISGSDAAAGNYLMRSAAKSTEGAMLDYGAPTQEEKVIRTVDMTIRSQRYQQDYEAVEALVQQLGGRIESLSVSGEGTAESLRRANFTLRIPAEQLDVFVSGAHGIGSVSSYAESSDDVRVDYYDVQSRLETQQSKMMRLQALMETAATTSELIELENAISDTQYMIEHYTSQIKDYDSRVNESTVRVTLREISPADAAEEKGRNLGERIVNALRASGKVAGELLQSFAVFAAAVLPWCLALMAAVVLVRFLWRRGRKHKK